MIDQTNDLRSLLGLAVLDEATATRLLQQGVQRTVPYGVAALPHEIPILEGAAAIERASDEVLEKLNETGTLAGSIFEGSWPSPTFVLMVTPDGKAEAERLLEETSIDYRIEQVDHSLQEIEALSHYLNTLLFAETPRPGTEDLVRRYLERSTTEVRVEDLAGLVDQDVGTVGSFQWDMATNRVQAAVLGGARTPATTTSAALDLDVVEFVSDSGDATPQPCEEDRCGPLRGGIRISNTAACSVGGAALPVNSTNQMFLTAAHCNNSNWNRRVFNNSGTYSSWFSNHTTTLTGGVNAGEGAYDGSRFDGQLVNAPDREVTSSFWFGANDRNRFYTSVETFASLSVNEIVCMRGQYNQDCGGIVAIGETTNMSTPIVNRFESQVRSNYDSQSGDSGGIVVDALCCRVTGIHSSSNPRFSSSSFVGDASATYHYEADQIDVFVLGLYDRVNNRDPDTGGFDYWRNTFIGSSCSLAEYRGVLQNFLFAGTAEIESRIPLTSLDRVKIRLEAAYWAALGRAADSYINTFAASIWNASNREAAWDSVANGIILSNEATARYSYGDNYEGRPCV